jgi:hypothetical protein
MGNSDFHRRHGPGGRLHGRSRPTLEPVELRISTAQWGIEDVAENIQHSGALNNYGLVNDPKANRRQFAAHEMRIHF